MSSNNIVEKRKDTNTYNRSKPVYKFKSDDFEIELPNKQSKESF